MIHYSCKEALMKTGRAGGHLGMISGHSSRWRWDLNGSSRVLDRGRGRVISMRASADQLWLECHGGLLCAVHTGAGLLRELAVAMTTILGPTVWESNGAAQEDEVGAPRIPRGLSVDDAVRDRSAVGQNRAGCSSVWVQRYKLRNADFVWNVSKWNDEYFFPVWAQSLRKDEDIAVTILDPAEPRAERMRSPVQKDALKTAAHPRPAWFET